MLTTKTIHEVVENFARTVATNTGAFVTERDLQAHLANRLRSAVDQEAGENVHLQPTFEGKGNVYHSYPTALEQGFKNTQAGFPPVHMEISIEKGERFDIAVFDETLSTITWDDGSKKFPSEDIVGLFELKFVKNWKKPPSETGFHPSEKAAGELSDEEVLDKLDFGTVGVKKDIEERLSQRRDVPYRCAIIVSNFNFYYYRPSAEIVEHNDFYEQMGVVARRHLAEVAARNDVNLVYIAPYTANDTPIGGAVWLYTAENGRRDVAIGLAKQEVRR